MVVLFCWCIRNISPCEAEAEKWSNIERFPIFVFRALLKHNHFVLVFEPLADPHSKFAAIGLEKKKTRTTENHKSHSSTV